MNKKDVIRIGNAGGYWGDDPEALYRQVHGGHLDYITMDFLAEVTMSIMQKQRKRDPSAGYARDFLGMLRDVLAKCMEQGTRIITNAGGVNPTSCAAAIEELARELGLNPKIAVVQGDDILPRLDELQARGVEFKNMESGASFDKVKEHIEAANIYFGAAPVVEALKWEPNIIITGRVTDTGITIAPMIQHFGWSLDDWDKLAAGIVAGHILECGCQVSGGNFTDWRKVESFDNIGYPIVEVHRDGSFVVTKHPNTGGKVSVDTVREQLFYEMGNPKAYITPDVVADFSSIQLEAAGENRVRVHGVRGEEPTELYKVSMAYRDGFKSVGMIAISGPEARAKAECFAKIFWNKCGTDFLETDTEYFGWNACHRSLCHEEDGNEIILRLGARAETADGLRRFGKLVPSLILSGPPGVAVLGGVPKPAEVVSYWPALIPKKEVLPEIGIWRDGTLVETREVNTTREGKFEPSGREVQVAKEARQGIKEAIASTEQGHPLSAICLGRSGDKGDMANIGIMARSAKAYDFIESTLTAQRVKDLFQELCKGPVVRYELPNMHGLNFLLENSLGGGGTMTLRTDAQGKTFAQALLRQRFDIPQDVLESC